MAKVKFCLVIDTEADFWRYIPSPHFGRKELIKWKINKILPGKFSRGREGISKVVKLLKSQKFPATFTIVGHLYLKECRGFPHFSERPEGEWLRRMLRKRWGYWDQKSDFMANPGLYLGDFIEREMQEKFFDLGLHAFSHEALTLESKESIDKIVGASVKAAKSCGIKPVSFGAPFNMIEDVAEPEKVYSALRRNGIKIVRFGGIEGGLKQMHEVSIKKPFVKYGLKSIHVSHYFEGNSPKKLIRKILMEISQTASSGKDVVYCLNTHDFTHRNISNLKAITDYALRLQREGKIEIVNMRQLI